MGGSWTQEWGQEMGLGTVHLKDSAEDEVKQHMTSAHLRNRTRHKHLLATISCRSTSRSRYFTANNSRTLEVDEWRAWNGIVGPNIGGETAKLAPTLGINKWGGRHLMTGNPGTRDGMFSSPKL